MSPFTTTYYTCIHRVTVTWKTTVDVCNVDRGLGVTTNPFLGRVLGRPVVGSRLTIQAPWVQSRLLNPSRVKWQSSLGPLQKTQPLKHPKKLKKSSKTNWRHVKHTYLTICKYSSVPDLPTIVKQVGFMEGPVEDGKQTSTEMIDYRHTTFLQHDISLKKGRWGLNNTSKR